MKNEHVIIFIATCLTLTGCVSTSPRDEYTSSMATRVYSHAKCPSVSKPEALTEVLAGLFLSPLIESSIKGLGESIKKASEDKVTAKTATTVDHFYEITLGIKAGDETEIGQNVGCITVVHGHDTDVTGAASEKVKSDFKDRFNSVYPKLSSYATINNYLSPDDPNSDILEFSDDIRFFAQYSVQRSEDKTAIQLEPQIVLVGSPFKKHNRFSNKKRDIVLVVNFKLPSQNGGDESFAVLTSNFSNVKDYTVLKGTSLLGHTSGWMPLPPVPDNIAQRLIANKKRRNDLQSFEDLQDNLRTELESKGLKPEIRRNLNKKLASAKISADRLKKLISADQDAVALTTPVTITASLVETQEGSKFLTNLGSYLSENNKDIAIPIFEAIDPASRKSAKSKDADSEDLLRIAAIEAVAAYYAEAAKVGSERDEIKIRVSKIKAKQACRKLKAEGHEDITCVDI